MKYQVLKVTVWPPETALSTFRTWSAWLSLPPNQNWSVLPSMMLAYSGPLKSRRNVLPGLRNVS